MVLGLTVAVTMASAGTTLQLTRTANEKLLIGNVTAVPEGGYEVERGGVTEHIETVDFVEEKQIDFEPTPQVEIQNQATPIFEETREEMQISLDRWNKQGYLELVKLLKSVQDREEELFYRRVYIADQYRQLQIDLLKSIALVQSKGRFYDKRALAALAKAMRLDPTDANTAVLFHRFAYHPGNEDFNELPEDEPEPNIRRRVLAQQKHWTEILQENIRIWQREFQQIEELKPAVQIGRLRGLCTRIEKFCAPDGLWTSRAILRDEENPNYYLADCHARIAELMARQPVYTLPDAKRMEYHAREAIRLFPLVTTKEDRLAWILDFATMLQEEFHKDPKGESAD
jgi:hypothetical protein